VAWFKEHVLFQPSYGFIKHLPVEEEDVPVPESVRDLVAETLRGMGNFAGGHCLISIFAAGHFSKQYLLPDTIKLWISASGHGRKYNNHFQLEEGRSFSK
jgi:hypothetical protein